MHDKREALAIGPSLLSALAKFGQIRERNILEFAARRGDPGPVFDRGEKGRGRDEEQRHA
jgi:hypothetical protein